MSRADAAVIYLRMETLWVLRRGTRYSSINLAVDKSCPA